MRVSAEARCIAQQAFVVVQVRNDDDRPVTVTIRTPYGTRTVEDVKAGNTAAQQFTTRGRSVAGGSVSVTATAAQRVDGLTERSYAARSCG